MSESLDKTDIDKKYFLRLIKTKYSPNLPSLRFHRLMLQLLNMTFNVFNLLSLI